MEIKQATMIFRNARLYTLNLISKSKKEYKLVDEENDEIYKKLVNYLG